MGMECSHLNAYRICKAVGQYAIRQLFAGICELDTLTLVLETEVLPATVLTQLFEGRSEQKGTQVATACADPDDLPQIIDAVCHL